MVVDALSRPQAFDPQAGQDSLVPGSWQHSIDVRDFIQRNYTPYTGDETFLARATERTQQLWAKVKDLMALERERGVLDADTAVPSSLTSHAPGYIDAELEQIVGLQTDKPLKRAIMPFGGIRVVEAGLKAYGYELDPQTKEIFTTYRKTHNDGVFDAYTEEMRRCRRSGIITGLPDAYGRGRVIGDYRRVALYGVDRLIEQKLTEKMTWSWMHWMKIPSVCEKSFPSRSGLYRNLRHWDPAMGLTWLVRPPMPVKRFNGSISDIWQQSKSKTVPPCRWDGSPPFWISTSSRICKPES